MVGGPCQTRIPNASGGNPEKARKKERTQRSIDVPLPLPAQGDAVPSHGYDDDTDSECRRRRETANISDCREDAAT